MFIILLIASNLVTAALTGTGSPTGRPKAEKVSMDSSHDQSKTFHGTDDTVRHSYLCPSSSLPQGKPHSPERSTLRKSSNPLQESNVVTGLEQSENGQRNTASDTVKHTKDASQEQQESEDYETGAGTAEEDHASLPPNHASLPTETNEDTPINSGIGDNSGIDEDDGDQMRSPVSDPPPPSIQTNMDSSDETSKPKNRHFSDLIPELIGLSLSLIFVMITICTVSNLLQINSKLSLMGVPCICIISWCQLFNALLFSNIDKSNLIIRNLLDGLLIGYCGYLMNLCFVHRKKLLSFRHKIYTDDEFKIKIIPALYSISVVLICFYSIFNYIILMINSNYFCHQVPLMLTMLMIFVHFLSEFWVLFRIYSFEKIQKWENILAAELNKNTPRWTLIEYILCSSLFVELWLSLSHYYDNKEIMNAIVAICTGCHILLDFIVVIILKCRTNKQKKIISNMNDFADEYNYVHVNGVSKKARKFDENFFYDYIKGHIDKDKCILPSALKRFVSVMFECDIKNGLLSQSMLYQILDILASISCGEVWTVLSGLQTKNESKKLPVQSKSSKPWPMQQKIEKYHAFMIIPPKRRAAYKKLSQYLSTTQKIPATINETTTKNECIYDWIM